MTVTDVLVLIAMVLVVGGAVFYIVRAKKKGQKCIGCPDSAHCGGACQSCKKR